MVEFESGRIIHMQRFDIQEVKEDCKDEYVGEVIKTIYKEVYVNVDEDEEDVNE